MNKEIEALHHPVMTSVEIELKKSAELRKDVTGHVLSGEEISDYILWMVEEYGSKRNSNITETDMPPLIRGGSIPEIGQSILQKPDDKTARNRLVSLYTRSEESGFFLNSQDITAGRFLRYFPAYWRMDDYFEIFYAFSGSCEAFFEEETVILKPGNILLIPPQTQKACRIMDEEGAVFFFMIRRSTFSHVFWKHLSDQNLMSKFFHEALSGDHNTSYLLFSTGSDEWIEELLYNIYHEYNHEGEYSSQLINTLMSGFFLTLLQRYEDTARISSQSTLHWKPEFGEIIRYIQNNYRDVTLAELTERFGYSERQLIRIIQNSTGSNFTQLQTKLRMKNAARMLMTGSSSIEMISASVGFSNLSAFYRAFTRYYGCPPGKYQQEKGSFDAENESPD